MDLPYDLQSMIEVYVAEAMRETGTARGSVSPRAERDPEPLLQIDDLSAYVIDESEHDGGLDYATLFDEPREPPPLPLPRFRAARGTRPPTGAEPMEISFDDEVTEVVNRPPTSER